MNEVSYIVVFPTEFSKKNIPQLINNIKKILKIQKQEFKKISRDGDIILVDANDPVFASSAINLLFGIKEIAIARKIQNNFNEIVNQITSIGGNLLLKGEKFYVKVEGTSRGFLAKDVEIASTSSIIEKKSNLGAVPGTENNFDKLLYTYLTKNNAYVCIFSDSGKRGIPFVQDESKNVICAVFDEVSAISCYETIKQGFRTKIIVCYGNKNELMNLAKMIIHIIPRLLEERIEIEFFNIKVNYSVKNYLKINQIAIQILLKFNESHISLPLSPLIFPQRFIDESLKIIFSQNKIPILPLSGVDSELILDSRELLLESSFKKIEKLNFSKYDVQLPNETEIQDICKKGKKIMLKIGPNNLHDILDAFE
jgi:hypothetical protein